MIQVTLNANEFEHTGEYNGHPYTSLKVGRISNGRIYFTTINNQMRMSTMAKQMKLENGNVVISFGKNDKMIIGTYVDTEAIEETKEEETITETVENTPVNEENSITETKEINSLKVSKEKETIIVRGYMGKVEEIEAFKINHPELELYLYKGSKYYAIYEKQTGKTITSPKKTKKEAMDKLEETLNGYYDKLKEVITETIEREGYITEYEIGSWIRSA